MNDSEVIDSTHGIYDFCGNHQENYENLTETGVLKSVGC